MVLDFMWKILGFAFYTGHVFYSLENVLFKE